MSIWWIGGGCIKSRFRRIIFDLRSKNKKILPNWTEIFLTTFIVGNVASLHTHLLGESRGWRRNWGVVFPTSNAKWIVISGYYLKTDVCGTVVGLCEGVVFRLLFSVYKHFYRRNSILYIFRLLVAFLISTKKSDAVSQI